MVWRHKDDIFRFEIAARHCERRHPWLIHRVVSSAVVLKRREARRVDLAAFKVAQIDDLRWLNSRHAVKAKCREAVLARVAKGGENLTVIGNHRRHADFVRHHVSPRSGRTVRQAQRFAIRRDGKRPTRMQSMRRLDGARFVKAFLQLRLWKTREAKARCNQFARPDGVVGAADDELCLRGLAGSEHRLKRETRSGIEGPEFAFVIELAPVPPLAAGWLHQRAFADEADARILVANELGAGARLDGEERDFSAIGPRRTQEPVARENGVETAHEHGLDMHAGEIEIFRVSAGLMGGDLAEAGEAQASMPVRFILEPDAPAQDGALRVGRDLHARFDPVQHVDDRETVETWLLDPIVASAPRRFKADRPGRLILLAHIKEMAPRL